MLTRILLDVYELVYEERRGITVIFPSTQNGAHMDALFDKRILTYEAYKQYLASKMCAKADMFEKNDPRLEAGQQKPVGKQPARKKAKRITSKE